jgi:hypothetical protein
MRRITLLVLSIVFSSSLAWAVPTLIFDEPWQITFVAGNPARGILEHFDGLIINTVPVTRTLPPGYCGDISLCPDGLTFTEPEIAASFRWTSGSLCRACATQQQKGTSRC